MNHVDSPRAGVRGLLSQIWAVLTLEERRRFVLLQPLVIFSALLEMAGLAGVVPFLALLSDEHALEDHPAAAAVYSGLGFQTTNSFFFAVGVGVLVLITVGNATSALTTWSLLQFSWMCSHTLSLRLLQSYMARPYSFFLENNSAELAKNILAEVNQFVTGILVAMTQMASRVVVLIGVFLLLFALDPVMAVGCGVVFGSLYGGMFFFVRNSLRSNGRLRNRANGLRHRIIQEAFGGVKELKLYGLEAEAAKAFSVPSRFMATIQAKTTVIGLIPRYALETIAFGGVLLIVLGVLWRGQAITDVMPVLGLYAFATYRMIPGLQAIFSGMTQVRFSLSSLETLHRDLVGHELNGAPAGAAVPFANRIELRDVHFLYRSDGSPVLRGVNIEVIKGQWIAFVGRTGAGKSTLVDLLLGLQAPTSGQVLVDGTPLEATNARSWQEGVAYVPQQIFLIDGTLAENICFGVPMQEIDMALLRASAEVAQIAGFIEQELPSGYDTQVGERGLRLSGGQRQRVGIARALYRNPKFLVLDEATSALDNETEASFLDSLRLKMAGMTVVSIAHRLTTTRDFDRIFLLENGLVADSGTFSELVARNPYFQSTERSVE